MQIATIEGWKRQGISRAQRHHASPCALRLAGLLGIGFGPGCWPPTMIKGCMPRQSHLTSDPMARNTEETMMPDLRSPLDVDVFAADKQAPAMGLRHSPCDGPQGP